MVFRVKDHVRITFSLYKLTVLLKKENSTFCSFVDLEKAFDWINRDILMYKLLNYNIDGNMYFAIKAMLNQICASIQLSKDIQTQWFASNVWCVQKVTVCRQHFLVYL